MWYQASILKALVGRASLKPRRGNSETIEECTQLHDACEAEALLNLEDRAFIAHHHGNYEEAAGCFEELRRQSGEVDDSALYTYGVCLKKLGRTDEALALFDEVIRCGRECHYDILAGLEKACILAERGNAAEATDALRKARDQDLAAFCAYCERQYPHLRKLAGLDA